MSRWELFKFGLYMTAIAAVATFCVEMVIYQIYFALT